MARKTKGKPAEPTAPDVGPVTSSDEEKRWRAEDALRTLTRAEEIRGDTQLMRDVERCRADQIRNLESIKVETAPRTIRRR